MRLIGSKTGAYEYWVVFPNRFKLWMGVRPTSDTDVSVCRDEICNDRSLDVFYEPPLGPYVEEGQLHTPENFNYLLYSLINKARKKDANQILIDYYESNATIEEGSGNPVGEICLIYEKSNNAGGHFLAAMAKARRETFRKHKIHHPIVNNI